MASNVNHRERLLLLQQEAERLRQETEQQTRLADLQDVIAHDQARYDVLRDELSKVKIRIRENVVAYEDLQHGDGSAMTGLGAHGEKVKNKEKATTTGSVTRSSSIPAAIPTKDDARQAGVDPEQLKVARQRYGNIVTGTDGKTYAISCHLCGANTPTHQRAAHFDNEYMDLDGVRRHYRRKHGIVVQDTAEILTMCAKDLIAPDDFDRIVRGQQPVNVKIKAKNGRAGIANGKQNRGRLPTQPAVESGPKASKASVKGKKRQASSLPPRSRPSVIGRRVKELSFDGEVIRSF